MRPPLFSSTEPFDIASRLFESRGGLGILALWIAVGMTGCSGAGSPGDPDTTQPGQPESLTPSAGKANVVADATPRLRPFQCKESKSPMFADQGVVEMSISADFQKLNTAGTPSTKDETASRALVRVADSGDSRPFEARIVARGDKRFTDCAFRPFSLKDLKNAANAGNPNIARFDGLGNSVKFATHCGDKAQQSELVHASTPKEYEQRVLMEHLVYQVVDQLKTPSLKTRLVKLSYYQKESGDSNIDDLGQPIATHLAFVREPEDTMAKRCGMKELEDAEQQPPPNRYSQMLSYLVNGFIMQPDWTFPNHNMISLLDEQRQETFYAPYDFDLVGIFRSNTDGLCDSCYDADCFARWLRYNQSDALFGEIDLLRAKLQPISEIIQGLKASSTDDETDVLSSRLSSENLALFESWLSAYRAVLDTASTCKGHMNDPSRPECSVEDDHSGALDQATPRELGSWTTHLETLEDVDTFAVELNPGALYTLDAVDESRMDYDGDADILLELLDSEGKLSASTRDRPISHRVTQGGRAYVRASLGDRLYSTPLGVDPREIALFLYEDDGGASVAEATALTPDLELQGRWEASRDEDWFRVAGARATDVLRIVVPSHHNFSIEIARATAPGENVETVDVTESSYEGTPFAEGGDYVVKLRPGFHYPRCGDGDACSYTVKLTREQP